ncbi:hypothetical protein LBMAG18_12870 [Alphaproteobacteria bacterium]|nr:hypothetical protein LBMAG18_12870 [Alphaproteobacteria bacterium]
MKIKSIIEPKYDLFLPINNAEEEQFLIQTLNQIHTLGPVDAAVFEKLALLKKFRSDLFTKYEPKLISLMGLFYKTEQPKSLVEEVYSIYASSIRELFGDYTPVQADVYKNIQNKRYFSFSAPTSIGKSYLFRDLIKNSKKDVVIVVPSRSLISEYINAIIQIVDRSTLVMEFIEIVNTKHAKKRIYVITPERGMELFKKLHQLDIEFFLFDEAQISEEEIRGMRFDSFVRRVDKLIPNAKKVFTHPFVENPEAQLRKHNFEIDSGYRKYDQNSVGKIYLSVTRTKKFSFSYFSPFTKEQEIKTNENVVRECLLNDGTILIYVSKKSIYDDKFNEHFAEYISLCSKITNPEALGYIEKLKEFIGASSGSEEKSSTMIEMMGRGIVFHHGSIPLKGRLLIEEFVNKGFAKICFSTSTLAQGINMPFSIVWIHHYQFTGSDEQKMLALKNLIGRSGRVSKHKNSFDYGYVIVEKENVKLFCSRIFNPVRLSEVSRLDGDNSEIDEDMKDVVEAIQNNSFDDELQLTKKQVERLQKADINNDIKFILDELIIDGRAIKAREYYQISDSDRKRIKTAFMRIFISHLRRNKLSPHEQTILSASIPILLWQIEGKSFSEIISLRHAYVSRKDERREIKQRLKREEITFEQAQKEVEKLTAVYSPPASSIPDSSKKQNPPSLFKNISVDKIKYDMLVYDTYDYIDKVISLSLRDPISAALILYFQSTGDERALILNNYIKYGTNDAKEIWLIKYGFSFDEIEWLKDYVDSVDENEIVFSNKINTMESEKFKIVERFLN